MENRMERYWLEPICEQEKKLVFERFDRKDALALGLKIIELAEKKYRQPVAAVVVMDGMTVFSHYMHGTSMYHEWWIKKKLNTIARTDEITMKTSVKLAAKLIEMPDFAADDGCFATDGGAVPIKVAGGTVGFAVASGMTMQEDHQLVADAMAALIGVKIPDILTIDG